MTDPTQQQSPDQPSAQPVQAQITPTNSSFGLAEMTDGSVLVIEQVHTVVGTVVLFRTAEGAMDHAANEMDTAQQAMAKRQAKLAVPVRGLLGPDGQPIFFAPNGHAPSKPSPEPAADDVPSDEPTPDAD